MLVQIPLVGPNYESRSKTVAAQVTRNLFPELSPDGREIVTLRSFPGLKSFATLGGADRGLHVMNGTLYAVSGQNVYSIDSAGAETNLGAVTGGSRCVMANDGDYLYIAPGPTGTTLTGRRVQASTGTVSDNQDADFRSNPTSVAYTALRMAYGIDDGEFMVSALNDGSDINALDFATAEGKPDDLLRVFTDESYLYLFGGNSIEFWYNSGVGRPPYDRIQNGVLSHGIIGTHAVSQVNDSIYYVDHTRVPRVMMGLQSVPIGNPAIGQEWSTYGTVDDCVCNAFTLDQQDFFQVVFPTAAKSWCYHAPSKWWFEMTSGASESRCRWSSYALCYNKHIVADYADGSLYELDFDTYTDGGDTIIRQKDTPVLHGGLWGIPGEEIWMDRLEVVMETGVGIVTGQGSDPEIMLQMSDDGGKTFGTEIRGNIGVMGDHKRVEWHQLGRFRERILRLRVSDPVDVTFISAHAEIDA